MEVLSAHVLNHDGWSEATITVTENGHVAVIGMEFEWEDRDGSTKVLCAEDGFFEGEDLCDRVYAATGYKELVEDKLDANV